MKLEKTKLRYVIYDVIRIIALWEVLIFSGIQVFWIIYGGESIQQELTIEIYALLSPLIITIITGFILTNKEFRIAIKQIEWVIHLLIALLSIILLFLFQFMDDFNSIIPFTWPFYLWLMMYGLVLISCLIINLDRPTLVNYISDKRQFVYFLMINIVIWPLVLYIISISWFPIYFWIFAALFHAILVIVSKLSDYQDRMGNSLTEIFLIRETDLLKDQENSFNQAHGIFRALYFYLFLIIAFILWNIEHDVLGSAEKYYSIFVLTFISPLFYIGFITAFILLYVEKKLMEKKRYKVSLLGDIFCIILICLSTLSIYFFAPFILGYTLILILIVGNHQSPLKNALVIASIQLVWIVCFAGFYFYGILYLIADISLLEILVISSLTIISISIFFHILFIFNYKRTNESLEEFS